MLNRVPLRRAGRQMRDGNRQANFIRRLLKPKLPQPDAVAIRAATVGFNQQLSSVAILVSSHPKPPFADRCHGECWRLTTLSGATRVVRGAHYYETLVARDVEDTIRDRDPVGVAWIITFQHIQHCPPVGSARFLEVPYQFALFGIHRNNGRPGPLKSAPLAYQIAHLSVAIRILFPVQVLAVGAQRVVLLPQQPAHCVSPDPVAAPLQFPTDLARCLPCPLQPADRIASRSISQQFVQYLQQPRMFFSTAR